MKKIFTLISMALFAVSVNAQVESYTAINKDGSLASEFTNAVLEGADLVATVQGTHAIIKGISSKTPTDIETDEPIYTYTHLNWPEGNWNNAEWKKFNQSKAIWSYKENKEDTLFVFTSLQGTGNPVTGWVGEPVMDGDTYQGKIRPNYDGYYFKPGESTKVPTSGEYFTFKADIDGMFRVAFSVIKANRPMYIVEASTVRTLGISEYKVEGYVNDCDNEKGEPLWMASIKVNDDYTIGEKEFTECYKLGYDTEGGTELKAFKRDGVTQYWNCVAPGTADERWEYVKATPANQLNQTKFGWFVFNAKANETYYIFTPNSQFGFRGYEFTAGGSIEKYTPKNPTGIKAFQNTTNTSNVNSAIYNLAGQKVEKSYKGMVIQNGKKFMNK